MLNDNKIYQTNKKTTFNISEFVSSIQSELFSSANEVLIYKSCFFVTAEQIIMDMLRGYDEQKVVRVEPNEYDISVLNGHAQAGVYLAKLNSTPKIIIHKDGYKLRNKFIVSLLHKQYNYLNNTIKFLHDHLNVRLSQGKKLTQYDSIRLFIADIICDLQSIHELLSDISIDRPDILAVMRHQITSISIRLGKLAGARAFLSTGITEMALAFQIINQWCLR